MEPVIPADTDQEIRAENTSPSPLFPPLREVPPEKRDDVTIRTQIAKRLTYRQFEKFE